MVRVNSREETPSSRVYGFASFYVGLHPAEDFGPAFAVTLGLLDVAGESLLADFYQCAGADAVRALMMQAVNVVGSSSQRTVVLSG